VYAVLWRPLVPPLGSPAQVLDRAGELTHDDRADLPRFYRAVSRTSLHDARSVPLDGVDGVMWAM
jgi:hypothetical protein